MKTLALTCTTLLAVALMPSIASADRYDHGDRYRGHSGGHGYGHQDHDRSSFSFSFGFGSGGYSDYSYANVGYSRGYGHGYGHHYRPYYRPAPVVVERYYAPPPVVYYPARTYYYDTCYRPSYYSYRGGYYR